MQVIAHLENLEKKLSLFTTVNMLFKAYCIHILLIDRPLHLLFKRNTARLIL